MRLLTLRIELQRRIRNLEDNVMGTTSDTYRRKKQITKEQEERFERLEEQRSHITKLWRNQTRPPGIILARKP